MQPAINVVTEVLRRSGIVQKEQCRRSWEGVLLPGRRSKAFHHSACCGAVQGADQGDGMHGTELVGSPVW